MIPRVLPSLSLNSLKTLPPLMSSTILPSPLKHPQLMGLYLMLPTPISLHCLGIGLTEPLLEDPQCSDVDPEYTSASWPGRAPQVVTRPKGSYHIFCPPQQALKFLGPPNFVFLFSHFLELALLPAMGFCSPLSASCFPCFFKISGGAHPSTPHSSQP